MDLIDSRLGKELEGRKVPQDVLEHSKHYGQSVANAILEWAKTDGGAKIVNMGFPEKYTKPTDPSQWVPTNLIVQQQAPLLPNWGKNRPFVLQQGDSCPIPAPLPYSEDKNSAFYKEALEVYQTNKSLTPEHATIARFWADDPMLSTTPPGQWVSVLTQIFEDKNPKLELIAEGYARLGLAVNDAFIGYWFVKYKYNLVRPVTYIQRLIDPKWQPLLNTPPFPEYPSGHSTQSAAVAEALTPLFGENFAYTDHSHDDDNFKPRPYPSFWAAAREAALSRLYGGIHFRRANENRLEMGKCVGMKVNALKFRR